MTIIDDTGKKTVSTRHLDENHTGVFIQSEQLASVLNKIMASNSEGIDKINSGRNPYGLKTNFFSAQGIRFEPDLEDDIKVYGLLKGKRVIGYIPSDQSIQRHQEWISKYKVSFPYAFGDGTFGETIPDPFIAYPREVTTETYLQWGFFDTLPEAKALLSYIKTKFVRALVGILKQTQHSTKTWTYVPLQDFTEDSDIDWTQSIHEIDQQLYEKYELSEDEIQYIEENVKEME